MTMLSLCTDPLRLAAALGLLCSYLAACLAVYRRHRRSTTAEPPSTTLGPHVLILYASQTGQAEAIARQTDATLRAGGQATRLARLDTDWASTLHQVQRLLIVASTSGEGDAPDHARAFAHCLGTRLPASLCGLPYAVLALGDRHYPAFCAFGHRLDRAFHQAGAQRAWPVIEVDQLDPAALAAWAHALTPHTAAPQPDFSAVAAGPAFTPWCWQTRVGLNPGSASSPMYRIRLVPADGSLPDWRAGDLVELIVPDGDGRPRSYSISNLPDDGVLELIVRSHTRPDGRPGEASHWLNQQAQPGDPLALRIRRNPGFHVPADCDRPLILIGAGTGIAGLRSHLQARAQARLGETPRANNIWLIFGERSASTDRPCQAEIDTWQNAGVITRLDLAFSRDDPAAPYVQHRLRREATRLEAWLAADALILICGCAHTMARDVDRTLRELLGDREVDTRLADGRILRDVF